ncbi:MAG: hypothetical protein ACRC2V_23780 [Xenococcaceae cyanobacterium]
MALKFQQCDRLKANQIKAITYFKRGIKPITNAGFRVESIDLIVVYKSFLFILKIS